MDDKVNFDEIRAMAGQKSLNFRFSNEKNTQKI